jgi:hypothetical protein
MSARCADRVGGDRAPVVVGAIVGGKLAGITGSRLA